MPHIGGQHSIHFEIEKLSPLQDMSAMTAFMAHADFSQDFARRRIVSDVAGEDPVQSKSLEPIFHGRAGSFRGIPVSPIRHADPIAEFSPTMLRFNPQSDAAAERASFAHSNTQS